MHIVARYGQPMSAIAAEIQRALQPLLHRRTLTVGIDDIVLPDVDNTGGKRTRCADRAACRAATVSVMMTSMDDNAARDLRQTRRELIWINHPDRGGDQETFVAGLAKLEAQLTGTHRRPHSLGSRSTDGGAGSPPSCRRTALVSAAHRAAASPLNLTPTPHSGGDTVHS